MRSHRFPASAGGGEGRREGRKGRGAERGAAGGPGPRRGRGAEGGAGVGGSGGERGRRRAASLPAEHGAAAPGPPRRTFPGIIL